jgi:hypothetical protein
LELWKYLPLCRLSVWLNCSSLPVVVPVRAIEKPRPIRTIASRPTRSFGDFSNIHSNIETRSKHNHQSPSVLALNDHAYPKMAPSKKQ